MPLNIEFTTRQPDPCHLERYRYFFMSYAKRIYRAFGSLTVLMLLGAGCCTVVGGCNRAGDDLSETRALPIQKVNVIRPMRPQEKSSFATVYGRLLPGEAGKASVELQIAKEPGERISRGNRVQITLAGSVVDSNIALIQANPNNEGFNARAECEIRELNGVAFGSKVPVRIMIPSKMIPSKQGGLWVPRSALCRERGGGWSVLVVQDRTVDSARTHGSNPDASVVAEVSPRGIIVRRSVTVLSIEDRHVQVLGEITSRDSVIVDGTHRVVEGQVAIGRGTAVRQSDAG